MGVYLGIDIGTSGTKTLAMDADGRVLAEACEFYPCSQPRPTWSEQDPEDWWRATVIAVRQAMEKAGRPEISGIGFSGQMHGFVLIGTDRRALSPAIIWADQRSADLLPEIESIGCSHGTGPPSASR